MNAFRLFFALWPPEELRRKLWHALAPLRHAGPDVRWVPPERLHITLRFMGDTSAGAVSRLTGAADMLSAEAPVRVDLTRTGAFPRRGAPRVYWIGVVPAPLLRLRRLLDAALAREGIAPEPRSFAPHLTVGRVRQGRGPTDRGRHARRSTACTLAGDGFTAGSLHLVRSELFPAGPRYANIHRVELTGQQE